MEEPFIPVPFEPSPGFRDPQSQEPSANNPRPSAAKKGRWGGARPGAGAPRGNLNALRHGRNSRYHHRLALLLAQIPGVQDALIVIARRRRKQQRQAESGAAALLGELLRRTGEIVLHPENNQLEINQELLAFLRSAEAQLREILEDQSSSSVN